MRIRSILILLAVLLALGGYFYFTNAPEPPQQQEPRAFAWLIEMDDIQNIELDLPREGLTQSFVKIEEEDKFPWYFDDAENSAIDSKRWGGGVPLLLSGPGVNRIISENTSDEKLAEYGIANPVMVVHLTLKNGHDMFIKVGDKTPDGNSFYVQAPNTRDVAIVDSGWYDVISGLVRNPPFAPPEQ